MYSDLTPCFNGAPGGIRTPDHLVRSQVLYPAELRARVVISSSYVTSGECALQ